MISRFYQLLIAAACSVFLLAACNKSEGPDTSSNNSTEAASVNIERVPADTAFLFTNLKAIPEDVLDSYLKKFSGSYDSLIDSLEAIAENDEGSANFMHAIAQFYSSFRDLESMQELSQRTGLSFDGQTLLYANDLFPVWINPITDANTFDTFITDMLGDVSDAVTEIDVDGVSVNQLLIGDDQFGIFWNVNDSQATATLLPVELESAYLSQTFGDARPAQVFNMAELDKINNDYDFLDYGSGFFDFIQLFNQLTDTSKPLVDLMQQADDADLTAFISNPTCLNETQQLLGKSPRMTFGYTELDENIMTSRVALELDNELQNGLSGIVGTAPISVSTDSVYSMALSLDIAGLLSFLETQSTSTLNAPFTCESLSFLNDSANSISALIDQPMPPFVGNIQGLQVDLADFDMAAGATMPEVAGNIVLFSKSPSMLVGLGQLTLPFLAELDLEPGSEPQQLVSDFVPAELGDVYLATSDEAIGLALGEQQVSKLPEMLNPQSNSEQYLMTFGLDYAAYGQLTQSLTGDLDALSEVDEDGNPISDEERLRIENARKMLESTQKLYEQLGYTYGTVKVTDKALVTDQTVELNR